MTEDYLMHGVQYKTTSFEAELDLGEEYTNYNGYLYIDEFDIDSFGFKFISKPFANVSQILTSEDTFYETFDVALQAALSRNISLVEETDDNEPKKSVA